MQLFESYVCKTTNQICGSTVARISCHVDVPTCPEVSMPFWITIWSPKSRGLQPRTTGKLNYARTSGVIYGVYISVPVHSNGQTHAQFALSDVNSSFILLFILLYIVFSHDLFNFFFMFVAFWSRCLWLSAAGLRIAMLQGDTPPIAAELLRSSQDFGSCAHRSHSPRRKSLKTTWQCLSDSFEWLVWYRYKDEKKKHNGFLVTFLKIVGW